MKLEIINDHEPGLFKFRVEEFIEKIANPETMKIQFEVKERHSGVPMLDFSYWAFILYDGELKK